MAALCAAGCAQAAAPRVALWRGAGSSAGSGGNYSAVLSAMLAGGRVSAYTELQSAGDVAGLRAADYDLVIFPGGGGSAEAAGIGAAGGDAVRAFVAAGRGYLGVCAGGYLAGHATCCDVVVPGYCGGAVGCAPSSYALGLADIGVAEPWARGHGPVLVAYDDAAVAMLRLDPAKYGGGANISMLYWQGPILDRQYKQGVQALATFHTEISSGSTQYTKGQMVGTPALFHTTYGAGKGRVLISPPHPEETQPRLDDIVESYILWASSAI